MLLSVNVLTMNPMLNLLEETPKRRYAVSRGEYASWKNKNTTLRGVHKMRTQLESQMRSVPINVVVELPVPTVHTKYEPPWPLLP